MEFGYFNTKTWEFIPVDKIEPGRMYWLNTPEHLEQAKLWKEFTDKFTNALLWNNKITDNDSH